jgi:hypothetical protein
MSQDDLEEAVGYCRPPRRTQFQKGQSGNPKGRPRGSRSLAAVLTEVLTEKVTVTENGKRRRITKLQVASTQLVNKAATGNVAAMRLLMALVQLVESKAEPAAGSTLDLGEADQMVMKQLFARMQGLGKGSDDEEP